MVNLELYRVFYTVAKCGSLTRAAEELFISQPAVSQAIKQLETQLGTPLFNRTHRGMELSAQGGKQIFKIVEEALAMLDRAENKLIELKTTATGTLRIGASDTIFSHILSDKIVKFHEIYPAVKFELLTATSPENLEQVKTNKCDVAFVNLPIEDKDVVFSSSVEHLNDIFVASPTHYPELMGKPVTLKTLQDYPLLMLDINTVSRRSMISFCHNLGIQLHPDIECGSWDLMTRLAINGMGIAIIPREYIKKELYTDKTLFEIDTEPRLPVRSVGIALPKNVPIAFVLREFLALFNQDL